MERWYLVGCFWAFHEILSFGKYTFSWSVAWITKQFSFKSSDAINKSERKVIGKVAVRAGKGFTLFISNEDMNGIIIIIKSLENLGGIIHSVIEIIKHEIKKQKGGFYGALLAHFLLY